MYNLLKADFFKLRKSKTFWGMIIVTILIAVLVLILKNNDIIVYNQDNLENAIINNINILGFVIVVFIGLFTGIEYSERYN